MRVVEGSEILLSNSALILKQHKLRHLNTLAYLNYLKNIKGEFFSFPMQANPC